MIDGNDSLKRIAKVGTRDAADTRILDDSDFFLPSSFVDKFADEVPQRLPKAPAIGSEESDDDDGNSYVVEDPSNEGDPTDGVPDDGGVAQCVKNWKAAADDSKKRSWGIFDENGIFASACRHGFILWLADLIKSGER